MALSPKQALDFTGHLDFVADSVEKRCAALGVPPDIAKDYAVKTDLIAKFVERAAGLKRDATGKLADYNPEDIGRETGGTLVGDPDESSYMGDNFSQQENRELSDLQESGKMPGVQTQERKPTPGKQADLDASLSKLSKLAHESEVHALGDLMTNLKICSARLSGSGVGNLGGLVSGINKVSGTLDKIQGHLIIAAGSDDGSSILVQDEAGKAVNAVQEIESYLVELSGSIQGVKAGSSPTAQLAAEETVKETSGKLGRLIQLAATIADKCEKKIAGLMKASDED
jgi:hypothetical protein